MQKDLFLTVIIPCYNEEANLKRGVLKEVADYLHKKSFSWEVIIVDDESTDRSREIVKEIASKEPNFRTFQIAHGGKPAALMAGIKKTMGRYILFSDMDQSTPIGELDKLLPYLKEGFDVVIGSRGTLRKNFPFYRKIGASVFMSVRRLLILPEINDTQCGFKLFEAAVLKKAFPKLEFFKHQKKVKGWKVTSFDVELLHILKKMGRKIKEVTVTWNDKDVSEGKGSYLGRYVKESVDMFKQIIRVKLNDLRGEY